MQDYYQLDPSERLVDSLPKLSKAVDSVATCFSGTEFPENPMDGMLCLRTDEKKLYQYMGGWKLVVNEEILNNAVTGVTAKDTEVTVTKGNGESSTLNVGLNLLKRSTAYKVGDIAYSPNLPSWAYLECTTAGTTGDTEPDFSNVSSGGVIGDGTVAWIIHKPFMQGGETVKGLFYVGDGTYSYDAVFRFRKDTTKANATGIIAAPAEGSYDDYPMVGFYRAPSDGEVCAIMGAGVNPWNKLRVYEDRMQWGNTVIGYVTKYYRSGRTSAFTLSNGLCVQTGYASINSGSTGANTALVTLPYAMADSSYNGVASCAGTIGAQIFFSATAYSTTQIRVAIFNYPANYAAGVNWIVMGMAAT